jgi:hypothetical protein
MQKYLYISLLFIFGWQLPAGASVVVQGDSLRPLLQLDIRAVFATTDPLGNLYIITPESAIEKYAPDGRLLTRYTQNRYGMPAYLDVSNPLKVLVWYADFRTVVWLDRSLTSIGELNLIDAGYPEVRTVSTAQDGNLWLYDEVGFRLRKIGADGRQLFESQHLNLLFPQTLQISCIRENEIGVLAAEASTGALQFDSYAQFIRTTGLTGITQFQIRGQEAYFIRNQLLCTYSLAPLPLPESCSPIPEGATRVWLGAGTVILERNTQIEVYSKK